MCDDYPAREPFFRTPRQRLVASVVAGAIGIVAIGVAAAYSDGRFESDPPRENVPSPGRL